MSKVTRRKHVLRETEADNFEVPNENQNIVKIVASRGNNLHEVEPADGDDRYLVSMPTKFRKNVWIKRGDFVLVEPIREGDKVKAEIVRILTPEHVRVFTEEKVWPEKFTKQKEDRNLVDEDGLIVNTNRPLVRAAYEEESDDDDGSEDGNTDDDDTDSGNSNDDEE